VALFIIAAFLAVNIVLLGAAALNILRFGDLFVSIVMVLLGLQKF
jgi:hypothetical protein